MIRKYIVSLTLAALLALLVGLPSIGVAQADGLPTPTPTSQSTDSGVSGGGNGGG